MDGYKLRHLPPDEVCRAMWEAARQGWGDDGDKVCLYQDFMDFLLLACNLRSAEAQRQWMKQLRFRGYIEFRDHDPHRTRGHPRKVTILAVPKPRGHVSALKSDSGLPGN